MNEADVLAGIENPTPLGPGEGLVDEEPDALPEHPDTPDDDDEPEPPYPGEE